MLPADTAAFKVALRRLPCFDDDGTLVEEYAICTLDHQNP
jgi:hypothetical protein